MKTESKKRLLAEEYDYGEINVARDVVDFQFIVKSDEDPDEIKFFLNIVEWSERSIELFINFTSPLVISKGRNNDAIICNFKNPNLFIS